MTKPSSLPLIGKGTFTKAYLQPDNTVKLISCCPIKEIMALGWFPDSPLFPTLTKNYEAIYHEGVYYDGAYYEYHMEYYPRLDGGVRKNLDPDQYEIYKTLRLLDIEVGTVKDTGYHNVVKAFETLEDDTLRATMLDAATACANTTHDIVFEISPRNIAIKDGKLILLDVFFDKGMLKRLNKRRGVFYGCYA